MRLPDELLAQKTLLVRQRRELAELIGFETRNKYAVTTEDGRDVAFAAEQQKDFVGMLLRQFLGHWRAFDIHVFDAERRPVLVAHHPFRWFFQRLEVRAADGRPLGALQQRFAFFTKRLDVEDAAGAVAFTVSSPLWRPWTFPFERGGAVAAVVAKKWAGLLTEAFLDKDSFRVEFADPALTADERLVLLAAALFIDLQYFEQKAG